LYTYTHKKTLTIIEYLGVLFERMFSLKYQNVKMNKYYPFNGNLQTLPISPHGKVFIFSIVQC